MENSHELEENILISPAVLFILSYRDAGNLDGRKIAEQSRERTEYCDYIYFIPND